jgi:subtilisin-like proprotein convertase family protein
VHYWGEDPAGDWIVKIRDLGNLDSTVQKLELSIHGTGIVPGEYDGSSISDWKYREIATIFSCTMAYLSTQ